MGKKLVFVLLVFFVYNVSFFSMERKRRLPKINVSPKKKKKHVLPGEIYDIVKFPYLVLTTKVMLADLEELFEKNNKEIRRLAKIHSDYGIKAMKLKRRNKNLQMGYRNDKRFSDKKSRKAVASYYFDMLNNLNQDIVCTFEEARKKNRRKIVPIEKHRGEKRDFMLFARDSDQCEKEVLLKLDSSLCKRICILRKNLKFLNMHKVYFAAYRKERTLQYFDKGLNVTFLRSQIGDLEIDRRNAIDSRAHTPRKYAGNVGTRRYITNVKHLTMAAEKLRSLNRLAKKLMIFYREKLREYKEEKRLLEIGVRKNKIRAKDDDLYASFLPDI